MTIAMRKLCGYRGCTLQLAEDGAENEEGDGSAAKRAKARLSRLMQMVGSRSHQAVRQGFPWNEVPADNVGRMKCAAKG